MAEDAIRALVFDVGQVIIRVNVDRAAATLGSSAGITAQQVLDHVRSDPRMRDFQEGRLAPQEWYTHLSAQLGLRLSFDEFRDAWNSILERELILDEALFAALGARYVLGLLSNTDPLHVAYVEAEYSFWRHFPARVFSCAVGVSKPHPAIFEEAIRRVGVAAAQILYIDDTPEHVAAARLAGMQTHHFRDPATLLAELHARKIL